MWIFLTSLSLRTSKCSSGNSCSNNKLRRLTWCNPTCTCSKCSNLASTSRKALFNCINSPTNTWRNSNWWPNAPTWLACMALLSNVSCSCKLCSKCWLPSNSKCTSKLSSVSNCTNSIKTIWPITPTRLGSPLQPTQQGSNQSVRAMGSGRVSPRSPLSFRIRLLWGAHRTRFRQLLREATRWTFGIVTKCSTTPTWEVETQTRPITSHRTPFSKIKPTKCEIEFDWGHLLKFKLVCGARFLISNRFSDGLALLPIN